MFNLPKTSLFRLLIKITLILIGIFTVYYLLFLKPGLDRSNSALMLQNQLNSFKSTLVQNRIAIVGFTQLDPNSNMLSDENSKLLGDLQKTNEEGLK